MYFNFYNKIPKLEYNNKEIFPLTKIEQCIHFTKILDGRIATCTSNSINIYNITDNFTCELKIISPKAFFTYISQFPDGRLLTTSSTALHQTWRIEKTSYHLLESIKGEYDDGTYKIIPISHNYFISCSADTISMYCTNPMRFISRITGRLWDVSSAIKLKSQNIIIFYTTADNSLEWEILDDNYISKALKRMDNMRISHFPDVLAEFDKNKLFAGGCGVIYIINIETYQIINIFRNCNWIVTAVGVFRDKILFGTFKGDIYEMNKDTFTIRLIIKIGKNYAVKCISQISEDTFASCSEGIFHLWKKVA